MKDRSVRHLSQPAASAWLVAASTACVAGIVLLARPAAAGTTLDTVPDSAYINLGNNLEYFAVGAVNETFDGGLTGTLAASGTVISPRFVLTAAHVSQTAGGASFNVGGGTWNGGTTYTTVQTITHPGWPGTLTTTGNDIGLLRLNTPVTGVIPASRYFGVSEFGKLGTSVGYGRSGTGLTGEIAGTEGTKRAVQNEIDAFGTAFGYGNGLMASDFDDPNSVAPNQFGGSAPTGMEGSIARGDSGGATYISINGRSYVAGVHSFIASYNPPASGKYGDFFAWTRVNQYNIWIDDNTANYWNTAGSGSFTNGPGWTLGQAPNALLHAAPVDGDITGFNAAGAYTITFSGATVPNYQVLARAGDVTLALNGSTYNLTSASYDGAMVIGRYFETGSLSSNAASITLTGGTVNLTAGDIIIAQLANSRGRLSVGANATLNVARDVYIGGTSYGNGGAGTLAIQNTTATANINGTLHVMGNGTVNYNAGTFSVGTLDVAGGRITVANGSGRVLRAKKLTISSGKLDLNDNDMIIDYTGVSPISDVFGYVASGFAAGLQNGDGIISTRAATSPNAGEAGKTRIGFGESNNLGLSTFSGISVDTSSILLKYTYAGDANLDGKVDIRDLARLAGDWMTSGIWSSGDFNYDGTVNAADLGLLASNWQAGAAAPLGQSFAAALSSIAFPVAVPEPTSILVLSTLLAPMLLNRRRRV